MTGFPPDAHGQVTLANWRNPPFNRWAFHHVRELIPSAEIANEPARVRELPRQSIGLPVGDLAATETDGLVVLHRGRIVYEAYGPGVDPEAPHILMSVTKSMLGLLAGILEGRGMLDAERPLTELVPELAATAYRAATIRHLLDMRAGVAFAEDYLATSGPIIEYRRATGWSPLEPGAEPSDLRRFVQGLRDADGPHGGRFHYISPNSDLLGWVLERATGRRYADLLSEFLWRPIGAERSAYITLDRLGAARAAGGMCVTTRDLARVGQLIAEGGGGIVPAAWIEDVLSGGDPAAWNAGSFVEYFPGLPMHYRSKWYVIRGRDPLLFGVGIHGQNLFIDRNSGIVIAKLSSQPLPLDAGRIARTLSMVDAIRRQLAG
jgi:CubicO group peptidase (beta-lactamase class C family)